MYRSIKRIQKVKIGVEKLGGGLYGIKKEYKWGVLCDKSMVRKKKKRGVGGRRPGKVGRVVEYKNWKIKNGLERSVTVIGQDGICVATWLTVKIEREDGERSRIQVS